jgi:hypothetical protein
MSETLNPVELSNCLIFNNKLKTSIIETSTNMTSRNSKEKNISKMVDKDKILVSEPLESIELSNCLISNDKVKTSIIEKSKKMTSRERKALKKKIQKDNALKKKRNCNITKGTSSSLDTGKNNDVDSLVIGLNAIPI